MKITVDEVKQHLKQYNLETSLTDDEITKIIDDKTSELIVKTGVNFNDLKRQYFERDYNNDSVILDEYPVSEIESVKIDGEIINPKEYSLFKPDGIIYFNYDHHGNLLVDYVIELSDEKLIFLKNIILDMFVLTVNDDPLLYATSIKEGDSSITMDLSFTLQSNIEKMINEFKIMNVQVTML